ncbi:MAG: hypothetical protein NTV88_03325 [Candidatus Micrarchaeota archaeon]|nr:hypothetical protein [Candidatus Micrarchaeota archaeon]
MKLKFLLFIALAFALVFPAVVDVPADVSLAVLQLRDVIIIGVVLTYLFASGRIADFIESKGRRVTKREVLLAPFCYMVFACAGVLLYFGSGAWVPPQDTIITTLVYLLLIPFAISIGLGGFIIHYFFHDRLNPVQSIDLSLRIVLAPVFDGWKGYWTAFGAAALIVGISTIAFYSSGWDFAKVTLDFLLLSTIVSLYYVYKALVAKTNEDKASGFVSALTIITPAIVREFFRELACAALALVPFNLFSVCPLDQVGNEVTLAISVLATIVLLIPIIPFAYAIVVNVLRFFTVIEVLLRKEEKGKPDAGLQKD